MLCICSAPSDSAMLTAIKTTSMACTRSQLFNQNKIEPCPTSTISNRPSLSHTSFSSLSHNRMWLLHSSTSQEPGTFWCRESCSFYIEAAHQLHLLSLTASILGHVILFTELPLKPKRKILDVPKHLFPLFLSKTSPSNWLPEKQRLRSCFLQAGNALSIL